MQLLALCFQPALLQFKSAQLHEERIDALKCVAKLQPQFISV